MIDGWTLKNLALCACSDEEEFVVRTERNRCDRVSEVEVRNDYFLCHVDDKSEAILVDGDQRVAIWRQHHSGNVASILKWECRGDIGGQIAQVDFISNRAQEELICRVHV